MAVLGDADAGLVEDLPAIVSNLAYGLVARFAAGELAITEILPTLDRALFRLTSGYERRGSSR
jgi:TetR/AcrR family transcriptional regulator, cholesterol catabolism regulator